MYPANLSYKKAQVCPSCLFNCMLLCVCSLNLLLIIPYRQKCTLQEPFTDLLQLPENATITHAGSDCALVKYLLLFFYFNHLVLSRHLMIFPLLYARRAVMLCFLKSIIKSHAHLSDVPQCLFTLLSAALLPNKETASRLVCDVHEYLWEYFPLIYLFVTVCTPSRSLFDAFLSLLSLLLVSKSNTMVALKSDFSCWFFHSFQFLTEMMGRSHLRPRLASFNWTEIWPFKVTCQNLRQTLTFSASSVQGCKCTSTHMQRNLDLQTN